MASTTVKYRKISWKALVKAMDKDHGKDIVVYDFNGRKFTEKQKKTY